MNNNSNNNIISQLNDIKNIPLKYKNEIYNNLNFIPKITFSSHSKNIFEKFIIDNVINSNIYTNSNFYTSSNYLFSIDLIEYDFEIYLFFIRCIDIAIEKINKNKIYFKLFENPLEWKFSICSGLMLDNPFTMDDIIFIPIKYIKYCYQNNFTIDLAKTIIHEKIHVSQRINEEIWDSFLIINDSNWKKIYMGSNIFDIIINNLEMDKNIYGPNEILIINPDTFNNKFMYVYLYKNKYYYGHYIYNISSNLLIKKFFFVDILNKKLTESIFYIEQEHPYELYAYKISKECVDF